MKEDLQVSCSWNCSRSCCSIAKERLILSSTDCPANKKAVVKDYVASTQGKLTLHFLLGYAPVLNPDELVRSHVKRTGVARRSLQKGRKAEPENSRAAFANWPGRKPRTLLL
jgi:hypothetical protein